MIDPAFLAILLTVVGGIALKFIEMAFTSHRDTTPEIEVTEQDFDRFLDDWIPHYLWYSDMTERLEKVSTPADLRQFDPMDYQGKRAADKAAQGILSVSGANEYRKYQDGTITADTIYPPQSALAGKPRVYLYDSYDVEYSQIEVDQLLDTARMFKTVKTGKKIAYLDKVSYDYKTGHEIAYWTCIRHKNLRMWTRMYDHDSELPSIAADFKCELCADELKPKPVKPKNESVFSGIFLNSDYDDWNDAARQVEDKLDAVEQDSKDLGERIDKLSQRRDWCDTFGHL